MNIKIKSSEKIFIAGSTGMVGSSIIRAFKKNRNYIKNEILAPSKKELNLLDKLAVKNWLSKNKPSIVIIAAAKVGGIMANSSYPADFI